MYTKSILNMIFEEYEFYSFTYNYNTYKCAGI